ncbi:MAG: TetR/AcrR family transcriptional regulator [Crocinitomicaceae bacterium]
MEDFQNKISFRINENVYLKDPLSSDLGKKMIRASIDLIEELGFDDFTFKKLANQIASTEASIYRYFENKHNLLAYLVMWYWRWIEYRLIMRTMNIESPETRLQNCMQVLTEVVAEDMTVSQVNEVKLQAIVIEESSKVYLNKKVADDNRHGFFLPYKDVVERVANIISEMRPEFKYPHMLVSTIIEGAHHQRFFTTHLPKLTNIVDGEDAISTFYGKLTHKILEK